MNDHTSDSQGSPLHHGHGETEFFLCGDGVPVQPSKPTKEERRTARLARKSAAPDGAGHLLIGANTQEGAAVVESMARIAAGAFVRRYESSGGRPVDLSTREELGAVYHAALGHAAAASKVIPYAPGCEDDDEGRRRLWWQPLAVRRGNVLGFRALRAWRVAVRNANRTARALLYGKGAELCSFASWSDLVSLKEAMEGGAGRTFADVVGDGVGYDPATRAAVRVGFYPSRAVRLLCWWYRQCLVVFWSDKGGQRMRAGLREDLRRLAHCARVARNGSLVGGIFGEHLGDTGAACTDAAWQAAKRLRERIAQGDRILSERPALAEQLLRLWGRRRWEARPWRSGAVVETEGGTAAPVVEIERPRDPRARQWWGVVPATTGARDGVACMRPVVMVSDEERQAARRASGQAADIRPGAGLGFVRVWRRRPVVGPVWRWITGADTGAARWAMAKAELLATWAAEERARALAAEAEERARAAEAEERAWALAELRAAARIIGHAPGRVTIEESARAGQLRAVTAKARARHAEAWEAWEAEQAKAPGDREHLRGRPWVFVKWLAVERARVALVAAEAEERRHAEHVGARVAGAGIVGALRSGRHDARACAWALAVAGGWAVRSSATERRQRRAAEAEQLRAARVERARARTLAWRARVVAFVGADCARRQWRGIADGLSGGSSFALVRVAASIVRAVRSAAPGAVITEGERARALAVARALGRM